MAAKGQFIDIVLLAALPASGKSETRTFLANLPVEYVRKELHMGKSVQLDDYPYVHFMRCVDEAIIKNPSFGLQNVFFVAPDKNFKSPKEWLTLTELLNEDYEDLLKAYRAKPADCAEWLFDRIDAARKKVGYEPAFAAMPKDKRAELAKILKVEADKIVKDKNDGIVDSLEGCTVMVEFARGGAETMKCPLPAPYGYAGSLAYFSPKILSKATILYIYVTPEISRAKNQDRADPNNPGSILNHGVPEFVMRNDYGCDDIEYLRKTSGKPDCVKAECVADRKSYFLPIGVIDNVSSDKTTFVRKPSKDPKSWPEAAKKTLQEEIAKAMGAIWKASQANKKN